LNALKPLVADARAVLDAVGIDAGLRPEAVSVDEFVKLFNATTK